MSLEIYQKMNIRSSRHVLGVFCLLFFVGCNEGPEIMQKRVVGLSGDDGTAASESERPEKKEIDLSKVTTENSTVEPLASSDPDVESPTEAENLPEADVLEGIIPYQGLTANEVNEQRVSAWRRVYPLGGNQWSVLFDGSASPADYGLLKVPLHQWWDNPVDDDFSRLTP